MSARFDDVAAQFAATNAATDAQFAETHKMIATGIEVMLAAYRGTRPEPGA